MPLNILIIGSGLAGLAAAAYLRKQHNITILEKSTLDFTRNDYGISVIANAYALLQTLGIDDSKLDMAIMTKLWTRTAGNESIVDAEFDTRKMPHVGAPSVLTRRSLLQRELLRLATDENLEGRPARVVQGLRVEGVDVQKGEVRCAKGEVYQGDLLIGADGINSVVRSAVLSEDGRASEEAKAKTHDLLAYMAQMPVSVLEGRPGLDFFAHPNEKAGLVNWSSPKGPLDKRRILAYHISPEEFQLLGYGREEEFAKQFDEKNTTILRGVPASRAKKAFQDFDLAIASLFNHHLGERGDGTVEVWRIRDVEPVSRWSHGKAILIGDSAHAVTPHAGQGCNIAFEDAEALGYILRKMSTAGDVQAALEKFVKIRKERAEYVANSSRHMGGLLGEEVGAFDRAEFGRRTYGYKGAEKALKEVKREVEVG